MCVANEEKCITSWADRVRSGGVFGGVPTRPSQTSPERAAAWERHRQKVGDRIRSIRVAQGRTQEELALTSGVTRNLLIDVEHGRRGLLYERLYDIAEALHVPIAELLVEDTK